MREKNWVKFWFIMGFYFALPFYGIIFLSNPYFWWKGFQRLHIWVERKAENYWNRNFPDVPGPGKEDGHL